MNVNLAFVDVPSVWAHHWRLVERHQPSIFQSIQTVWDFQQFVSVGSPCCDGGVRGEQGIVRVEDATGTPVNNTGLDVFYSPFLRGVLLWKYGVCLISLFRALVMDIIKSKMR